MIQLAVVIKSSTLMILREHSTHPLNDPLPLNEQESLVLLDAEVVQTLLSSAQPGDSRIDDVILRRAL